MSASDDFLRRMNAALVELSRSRTLADHGLERALCEITNAAAHTMRVDRVGVWLFDDARTAIRCVKLYEATEDCHSSGLELTAANYPRYFDALAENRFIKADDAVADARTAEFAEGYLIPLGITSMMDAPVRRAGELVGVVCHEHVGAPRVWNAEEEWFAGSIADFVALTLQEYDRILDEEEKTKLIAELERRNSEQERFTYTVSHDLKSPLVTISGFLQHLKTDAAEGNQTRVDEDIRFIQKAVDDMQELLEELLHVSRVGHMMGPPERVSLAEVVEAALNATRGARDRTGAEIVVAPGFPAVLGNRTRLVEVVQNLLDNAIRFSSDVPNPRVEVGIRETTRDRVVVFVRDNGIGIEPRHHERIFLLFEKLDPDADGVSAPGGGGKGGAGVGLALARRIVDGHGGRLWVESDGLGRGTTFCFSLPLAAGDAAA